MLTPPPAMISHLRAECFETYASYSTAYHDKKPIWLDTDDGLNRTWYGTIECDGKRILFEQWIEMHPFKRRPLEAPKQVLCFAMNIVGKIATLGSGTGGSVCGNLDGDNNDEATYAR